MPRVRFIRPVHAIRVYGARPRCWQIAVPHFVGVFGQLDAFEFAFAPIVEQTKLDLGGMARKQGKIDTKTVPCGTEWERFSPL